MDWAGTGGVEIVTAGRVERKTSFMCFTTAWLELQEKVLKRQR
jgi:hypothetical protein